MTPPRIQHSPIQPALNIVYNDMPLNIHSRNQGVVESHTDPGTGNFNQQQLNIDENGRRADNKTFSQLKTMQTP